MIIVMNCDLQIWFIKKIRNDKLFKSAKKFNSIILCFIHLNFAKL